MRIAIFPGSFDPYTIGHADIVKRALPLFDKIIIAIGINTQKKNLMTVEERVSKIASYYADDDRIEVCSYSSLTVDLAAEKKADFIVRGVRSAADFEYERTIAEANRRIAGIETVILYASPEYEYISSSLVRELSAFGKDVSKYLPQKNI